MLTVLTLLLLASACLAAPPGEEQETLAGHRVLRWLPRDTAHHARLARQADAAGCSAWKEGGPGRPADYLCSAGAAARMVDELQQAGTQVETLIEDVAGLARQEAGARLRRQAEQRMNWDDYQRYDTIMSWLDGLAADNPGLVTLTEMGRSHEGRRIVVARVGRSPRGAGTRAVWIDGGIHAREWIAIATASYMLQQLVEVFRTNSTADCDALAVQAVDWFVAPLLNPDGYEYSHTNQRMWRKNRSRPPAGSSCYGVDLNRNWDVVGFGAGATSSNPCSETYKGTARNSEPETQAIAAELQKHRDTVRIYLSFHSYGQYWLTSYGYKTELPMDNAKLVSLGRAAVDAIQCVTPSRSYTIGSAGAIFYIAGGASDDYAKAAAHIPYSFTVELPDRGQYGFLLPANQILTVGRELWATAGVLAREAARHPDGPDPARED